MRDGERWGERREGRDDAKEGAACAGLGMLL